MSKFFRSILKNSAAPQVEKSLPRPKVFFDVSSNGSKMGRIEMELFSDIAPATAENFRALCTGEKGTNKAAVKLHYKGVPFHRIIPGFMCQGGDITSHNGYGGESIYGEKFGDENFNVLHTEPGMLSMANSGPGTNGSQFFITLVPCEWLDGKHVVFGRVVKGFEIVKMMEKSGSQGGQPLSNIVIEDCGQFDVEKQ